MSRVEKSFLLVALLLNSAFISINAIELIGHRGGFCDDVSFVPEHSPASYSLGARAGVKYLEPDVISTKVRLITK